MLKILKITKTAEYQKISKNNEKFYSQSLILLRAKTPEFYNFNKESGKNAEEFCRFGVTASKKVGNAVTRNRAKRRLREAFRAEILRPSADLDRSRDMGLGQPEPHHRPPV